MGLREFLWPKAEERDAQIGMSTWLEMFQSAFAFNGVQYTLPGSQQENLGVSFSAMSRGGPKGNGVIFACMANRMDLFAEASFMFRRLRQGRPGDLFSTTELRLLETPWAGGTTGDLLSRMILHVDLAGNAYVARRPRRLTTLRPDWVEIIGGVQGDADASVWHPDAEVLGYAYTEGGPGSGNDPEFFLAEQVAHFAPRPDPEAAFRGMSWLSPIVREVMADNAMTDHKLAFFENGATPNVAVKLNVDNLEKFKAWVEQFSADHAGVANAYKTMFLGAGADVTVVGADMRQLDFKITQGAAETRIAAAAGVPPVIVGLSEGLAAATYSNYSQARRRFADQTMRPLWRNVAGSLARIVNVPSDAKLWYDDRDIPALQEDLKDRADIQSTRAQSIKTLLDAGYEADSVVAAVTNEDFTLLKHSGLFSVQLQPPGTTAPVPDSASNGASSNGAAAEPLAPVPGG